MNNKIIYNKESKQRLDIFLANELSISRSKATNLIKNNQVSVNDKNNIKPGYELTYGDIINIIESKNDTKIKIEPIQSKLDILYEDKYFMIINKPNNILVHPSSFNEDLSIASQVKYYFKSKDIYFDEYDLRWGICHRLDKDTTGLLIVAKSSENQKIIQKMIMDKKIKREYIGLVKGKLISKKIKIDAPLARNKNKSSMTVSTNSNAKNAITYIELLEEFPNFSKVKFRLHTGRTHQIRAHCEYIKNPIINDPIYNSEQPFSKFHQFLHAFKISFISPFDKKVINVESKLPKEFDEYIKKHKDK